MRFHRPHALRTRPLVSVVVPCYNYGRFLPGAVASALDQHGVDMEVLIVDDASTDGSAEVAVELARSDPRVDVLLHEENRGHIQTYNDGLAKVSGDYVILLSADDLLAPNAVTRAVALMERHPRVGLVYGWAQTFEGNPPATSQHVRSWSVWPGDEWFSLSVRRGRCFLSSPEAVMRREALDQTDGYDVRLPHSGDYDMWLRTAAHWDVGRVNGPAQAYYRVHDTNMHVTTFNGWLTDLGERRRALDIVFGERITDRQALRGLQSAGRRSLAREALHRGLDARRDHPSAGGDELAALRDFAAETDPAVLGTWLWHRAERSRARPAFLSAAGRLVDRGRSHLEWRRRRRYGT